MEITFSSAKVNLSLVFLCSSLEPGRDGVGDYVRRLVTILCDSLENYLNQLTDMVPNVNIVSEIARK